MKSALWQIPSSPATQLQQVADTFSFQKLDILDSGQLRYVAVTELQFSVAGRLYMFYEKLNEAKEHTTFLATRMSMEL